MSVLRTRGMTLIDVIVGIALMLVVFLALFGMLRASLALSALAKSEDEAVELASAQMEYLRGLSYDALGTLGGTPSGAAAEAATTTVDGAPYAIRTTIVYGGDGQDYKQAEVRVTTSGAYARSYTLTSTFAP